MEWRKKRIDVLFFAAPRVPHAERRAIEEPGANARLASGANVDRAMPVLLDESSIDYDAV